MAERDRAYKAGGYRERYAMDNGKETEVFIRGERCLKYTYDINDPYQDANGAIWNVARGKWIY